MKELLLRQFILDNPEWEKKLIHDPYNLEVTRDGDYALFKYNQKKSNFHLPEVREARGIIFRREDWKCVCHPFDKFGNFGEAYCPEIKWENASVQEKIDGSLIKIWYDNNQWHISTNGTIDAAKAELGVKYKTFKDLVLNSIPVSFDKFTEKMNKNICYLFELVSPFNRIVIEYKENKLYFLGEREMTTGQEILPENSTWYKSIDFKIDIPKRFNLHSLDEVRDAAKKLPWNEEGYVVCDENFNRVKIKSPSYVAAHYGRNNGRITYERLLKVVLMGEKEEFLIYAKDFQDQFNIVENSYNSSIQMIKDTIARLKPETFSDQKSYAEAVMQEPKWMHQFLFKWKNVDDLIKNISPRNWIGILKEKGDLK